MGAVDPSNGPSPPSMTCLYIFLDLILMRLIDIYLISYCTYFSGLTHVALTHQIFNCDKLG